jgi:hypothetical protein
MVLAVEADDHGGELAIRENEVALAVMAVDEHAEGLERDVEGHGLRLQVGAEDQLRNGRTPRRNGEPMLALQPERFFKQV